ncbi:LysR family transcriptional regulator [Novosphingobium album (ex Hu et al. 2023)]|uniref:LysR family transcriptional regulator n=1 Tax=Novosphingobium album (ex Hu et al. 2023) TaxID=2930093 RepID=A0ABT0AZY5_9SPHN|nr:LysR family transcriptional regulator [Novosphingobium album (ex Hu et al. 2023)]MCJ2178215.1 LysR family transcriptional regulator [Novosphingobium album (ex Hu et al. 2023)]
MRKAHMMELRTLRHFVAVARRLNYSRAAEDVGLSQSALTRSIQSLEKQTGLRLFDRTRAAVTLTPQGKAAFQAAQQLLASAEDFAGELGAMAQGKGGRLSFGVAPVPARVLLASVLSEVLHDTPRLECNVLVRDPGELWPMLETGEIEFFIAGEGQIPEPMSARIEPLGTFPVSIVVRAGHPATHVENIDKAYPLLMANRAGADNALISELLQKNNHPLHVIEDFTTLLSLVQTTDALLLVTPLALQDHLAAGTLRELRGKKPTATGLHRVLLYSKSGRTRSKGANAVRGLFQHAIRNLAEPKKTLAAISGAPN